MKRIFIIGLCFIALFTACARNSGRIEDDNRTTTTPGVSVAVESTAASSIAPTSVPVTSSMVRPSSNAASGMKYEDYFCWLDEGVLVTPQDQMALGACAVFASTSMFEAYIARTTGELVDLSEQHYIVSSPDWSPDSGVSPESVLNFFIAHGVVTEEKLPYSPEESFANNSADYGYDYRLDATWGAEPLGGKPLEERINIIKYRVLNNGPVTTVIDYYEDFKYYSGGVYQYDGISQEFGGHWINIIGWANDDSMESGGYWICKNSFGTDWGEGGYCRIAYGDASDVDAHVIYFIYNDE